MVLPVRSHRRELVIGKKLFVNESQIEYLIDGGLFTHLIRMNDGQSLEPSSIGRINAEENSTLVPP